MKPVYPEILTADNTLAITDNGDGTITINPNQEFLIQDVKINTSNITNRTFTINPSTTYHLRFSLNGTPINNYTPQPLSFYLVDINDTNYNPDGVAETDTQFDTKYDDMLVAKIESDANNVITITSLKNKRILKLEADLGGNLNATWTSNTGTVPVADLIPSGNTTIDSRFTLNWSRKPTSKVAFRGFGSVLSWGSVDSTDTIQAISVEGVISRYSVYLRYRYHDINNSHGSVMIDWYLEA